MKTKKIIALTIAVLMVMSFGLTAMAAQEILGDAGGTLLVKNVSDYTELEIHQILYITKTEAGTDKFEFVNDEYKAVFVTAIGDTSITMNSTTAEILIYISENWSEDDAAQLALRLAPALGEATYTEADGSLVDDTLSFEVQLGYYLLIDKTQYELNDMNTVFLMLGTVSETETVTLKTTTYTVPVKTQFINQIKLENSDVTVKNGDVVTYTITVKIPNYSKYNEYDFIVVDTMGIGLEFDQITSVKIGDDDFSNYGFGANGDSTTGTVLVFDFFDISDSFKGYIGAELEIVYTAIVNVDFDLEDNVLTNDVIVLQNGVEMEGEGTELYTYGIQVNKKDEYGTPLDGVKFELYLGEPSDAPLSFTLGDDGVYYYDSNSEITELVTINGVINVFGLDNGAYYLKETKTLEGYNLLSGAIEIVIYNANGSADVINYTGIFVPGTGGIGTTLFIVIGSLVILGGVALLIVNRKKVFGK